MAEAAVTSVHGAAGAVRGGPLSPEAASGVPVNGAEPSDDLETIIGNAYDEQAGDPPADPPADPPNAAPEGDDPPAGDDPPPADPPADPPAGDPEPLEPPAHWSLEDQNRFREATPEWQAWLAGRSKAIDAHASKRGEELAPLRQLEDKWRPYAERLGGTFNQLVDGLMQAEYALRTGTPQQKSAIFQQLAGDYGVNLAAFGGGQNGAPAQPGNGAIPAAPPEVEQVLGDLDPSAANVIRMVLARQAQTEQNIAARLEQRDGAAYQANAARAAEDVKAFAEAVDEQGKPAHPYFAEVYDDMTRLAQADMAAGLQPNLANLYERATWAHPEVRAKQLAAQQHAAEQQRKRKEQEDVQRAKKAGVSVSGAGSATREQPSDDLDDILEELVPQTGW